MGRRDLRLTRFRQVLLAALRTRGYRRLLECAGLTSPAAITRLGSIEEALREIPVIDSAEFHAFPVDFYNPAAPPTRPQALRFPTGRQIRTAVLAPGFAETDSVRVFRPAWIEQIRQFHPEAIAASANVWKRLARAVRSGAQTIPTLTRSVVVFTGFHYGALEESERDLLWQVFELPIFEQRLGSDGSLLAWECEAHEGLHTVEENGLIEEDSRSGLILTSLTDLRQPTIRVATGIAAAVEHQVCACSKPGPRLIRLSAARAAAAGA